MRPTLRLFVLMLAAVLFLVAAYLSTSVAEKLTRAGFALLVLAWLLP
jgi:hypothetical protein